MRPLAGCLLFGLKLYGRRAPFDLYCYALLHTLPAVVCTQDHRDGRAEDKGADLGEARVMCRCRLMAFSLWRTEP
jgi:hypothetical protein